MSMALSTCIRRLSVLNHPFQFFPALKMILASLVDVKMGEIIDNREEGTHSLPLHSCPHSDVRKSDTISNWPLPLAFGLDLLVA